MPTVNLVNGPARVDVRNQSGDKVITGVKIGVTTGGQSSPLDQAVPTPVTIPPNNQETITNNLGTGPSEAVCVELDVYGHGPCSWFGEYGDKDLQEVARVLLIFFAPGAMDMKVWSTEAGTPMVTNLNQGPDCAGGHPGA